MPPNPATVLRNRPGMEYLSELGGWHFTRQHVIPLAESADFYALYRLAFEPIRALSVARQVLTEAEFSAQMQHERVAKYIAWNDAGEPVGLTTLSNDLTTTPWVNPDYFARHYPEQWARRAVYYLGFTIAHPSLRHRRIVDAIVAVGLQEAVEQKAVIAYDVCSFNNERLRFTDRVTALLANAPNARLEQLDTQSYSCVIF